MKKIILPLLLCGVCSAAFAADKTAEATQPADAQAAVQLEQPNPSKTPKRTPAEQKKAFEARRKLVKKLVKQYRKASDEQKPAIKARLAEVVSESVDANLAYVKERIAAERANLDNWEQKVQESEKNLDELKARRVEDLLSGEAKRKHKAAKKEWKKQIKEAEKQIQ